MNSLFHHLLRSPISTLKRMASSNQSNFLNKLVHEKSPYLLQHAYNPVNWYPWGEEAFNAAKEQNKLIFLSVGYSTCHWCHVMEKESFEDERVAAIMNEHFINVKVDREERPDVDQVYMNFVTSMSGSGGWPMSVWLTPDLHPVYGGTYFPPNNRYYGRPGFPTLLQALAKQWTEEEEKIRSSGTAILSVLQKNIATGQESSEAPSGIECSKKCFSQLKRSFEPEFGGFSESPKFPQVSNLNFLFTFYLLNANTEEGKKAKDMALNTLTFMARGGIHDHVSQGFARYSTDKQWHVPHFEKMLYDQAQLVHTYLDAYLVTGDSLYSDTVRDILHYVMRDLSHLSGGFYSAEDADSLPTADSADKKEGAFCVWTKAEVSELLSTLKATDSPDSNSLLDLFCQHFGVVDGGNVDPMKDPHDELKHQNVLIQLSSLEETASEFDLSVTETKAALDKACKILYDKRQERPRPHLDDKMVTAWNGMMLSAVCRAGAVLSDSSYLERALKSAEFIEKYLANEDGRLYRASYRDEDGAVTQGPHKTEGFCDDYAWVVRGFISLYETTLEQKYLERAYELQKVQDSLFWDTETGGYFTTKAGDSFILLRMKDDHDGAEPSVNSISAGNLLKFHRLLGKAECLEKVKSIFAVFSERLGKIPISLTEMTAVQLMESHPTSQVILSGEPGSTVLNELISVVQNFPHPNRVLLGAPKDTSAPLYKYQPSLKNYIPKDPAASSSTDQSSTTESAKAYVCHHFACSLPMVKPEELRTHLDKAFKEAVGASSN